MESSQWATVSASTEPIRVVSGGPERVGTAWRNSVPGRGGRESFFGMPHARRTQKAADLGGTDLPQSFLKGFRQRRAAPLVVFEPDGQRRLEQLAAQLTARQPHGLEHRQHLGRLIDDFGAAAFGRGTGQRTVQKPQGGFAMITAQGAKLIKDQLLVRTTGAPIAAADAGQRLAFGGQTQVGQFGNHQYESTYR